MILDEQICRLAHLSGIEMRTSVENKVYLLQAMGILSKDFDLNDRDNIFNNKNLLDQLIKEHKDADFLSIMHHVPIMRRNRVNDITISLPEGVDKIHWKLMEDGKNTYTGETPVAELEQLRNDGCSREIDGVVYHKYKFRFPFEVKLGYHNIEFDYQNRDGKTVSQNSRLISAPEKCYDRIGVKEGKKTWGVPVQLYEQVSENNLGIGNYSDLAQIGNILGRHGAGILGVNPLHAMRDDQPENASPYEPDSRQFFNYIYVDVTATEEFKSSKEIQDYYNSPEFQEKVTRNRRKGYVDYATTQMLVDDILSRCFAKFISDKKTEEYKRFCVFCDDLGDDLESYATFRALSRLMSKQDPAPVTWQQWPREYKDYNSEFVTRFREQNRDAINYYKYTQWIVNHQLQKVQEACLNSGMSIGLYTDAAVGCSCKGFEAWRHPELYLRASVGAPPDILSQSGQNWNILGFNPRKLQEAGYEPYRKILEANMKYAGCIRIDHVLQLQRLYMIPEGKNELEGTFIYYNPDELMAMVALESHLNKTMIIGEDLGELPLGFREKLEDFGILSYRVLPFEREWGFKSGYGSNAMHHPDEYPQASVCATSTHDTETVMGQWNVQGIYQKRKYGFLNEAQANDKFEQYATQREALNWALSETGSWERVGGRPSRNPRVEASYIPEKYVQAVADYLGQSNSAVMLIPFSDIFCTKEMGNIPGIKELDISEQETPLCILGDKAYPNWRKKMHIPVEHMEKVPEFLEITSIINGYRPDGNNGKGRFYQFHRMGEEKESVIDFEHYQRIYNIIKNRQDYEFSNLIEARYSERSRQRLERRRIETQRRYQEQKEAFSQHKREMREKNLPIVHLDEDQSRNMSSYLILQRRNKII